MLRSPVDSLNALATDISKVRAPLTLTKHVGTWKRYTEFCTTWSFTAFPLDSDAISDYFAVLSQKTRRVSGQTNVICTSVTKCFDETLNFVCELNELERPVDIGARAMVRKGAANRLPTATHSREAVTRKEYSQTVARRYQMGELWAFAAGFGIEMQVSCGARFVDMMGFDMLSTLTNLLFKLGADTSPPPGLPQWRTEKFYTSAAGIWGARLGHGRKQQPAPMWVCLGEVNSPLMSRFLRFCCLFGLRGGVLRKIDRRAKPGFKPGTRNSWTVTDLPIAYGGAHGWNREVKDAFLAGGVDPSRIPEKGVCDITPHMLRKLAGSFVMDPFALGGLELHSVTIPVALGASQLGSRDLDVFLKTYAQPSRALRIEACSRMQLDHNYEFSAGGARATVPAVAPPTKRARVLPAFLRTVPASAPSSAAASVTDRDGMEGKDGGD